MNRRNSTLDRCSPFGYGRSSSRPVDPCHASMGRLGLVAQRATSCGHIRNLIHSQGWRNNDRNTPSVKLSCRAALKGTCRMVKAARIEAAWPPRGQLQRHVGRIVWSISISALRSHRPVMTPQRAPLFVRVYIVYLNRRRETDRISRYLLDCTHSSL